MTATVCAQTRYARLGELDGTVETQIHPSEPWRFAARNTPLLESSWVRTGSGAHVEIELDDGSVLRLAENSLCELADYTRLSTGQRITHIALDRGVAYFTGEAGWRDTSSYRPRRRRFRSGAATGCASAGADSNRWLCSKASGSAVVGGPFRRQDAAPRLARPDKFYLCRKSPTSFRYMEFDSRQAPRRRCWAKPAIRLALRRARSRGGGGSADEFG